MIFEMNGWFWTVKFVNKFSYKLVDRTGTSTLATTDPNDCTVYISTSIRSSGLLERVVKHELAHCVMLSYGLVDDIHRMSYPKYWVEAEEFCCNLIADYSKEIWILTSRIVKGR